MRIAQVVTYISADGAFGGPVAVAVAQSVELARLGHEVHLVSAWDGIANVVAPGVQVHLYRPFHLFPNVTGLASFRLWLQVARISRDVDVIHLHFGRDLISLVSAWCARSAPALFVQTHGMIAPDTRLRSRVADLASVRSALRRSRPLALTVQESINLNKVARTRLSTVIVRNGVSVDPQMSESRNQPPLVMFLGRLHPRKRVLVFAEAARILRDHPARPRFIVVGPDEGDLRHLKLFIDKNGLSNVLTYAGTAAPGTGQLELAKASIYVLPSIGEVYPMTVLEALAVGTPVVLSNDCGLAPELAAAGAAVIVSPDANAVATAVRRLLAPGARGDLARRGHTYAQEHLDISSVARRLVALYSGRSS